MKKRSIIAALLIVFIGLTFAFSLCVDALSDREVFALNNHLKVVVDAGHGGIDGGVTGRSIGVKESDINLKIALQLCEKLEKTGLQPVLTRKTKEGLYDTTAKGFKRRDMQKRKEIIERENPALVLSIHQNFYPSAAQRGAQVFYLEGDKRDEELAVHLQNRLNELYAKEGVKARKNKAADYFILASAASCPAALVECGFLSNLKDEALLCSEEFLEKLTTEIYLGVVAFLFASA